MQTIPEMKPIGTSRPTHSQPPAPKLRQISIFLSWNSGGEALAGKKRHCLPAKWKHLNYLKRGDFFFFFLQTLLGFLLWVIDTLRFCLISPKNKIKESWVKTLMNSIFKGTLELLDYFTQFSHWFIFLIIHLGVKLTPQKIVSSSSLLFCRSRLWAACFLSCLTQWAWSGCRNREGPRTPHGRGGRRASGWERKYVRAAPPRVEPNTPLQDD